MFYNVFFSLHSIVCYFSEYLHSNSSYTRLFISLHLCFYWYECFYNISKLPLIDLKKYRLKSLSLFNFTYYLILVLIIASLCYLSLTIMNNIFTSNSLLSFVFEGHQKMRKVYGLFSSNYSFGLLTYFTLWFGSFFLPVRFSICFFNGDKISSFLVLLVYPLLFLLTGYKSYIVFFFYMPLLALILLKRSCFILNLKIIFSLFFFVSSFMVFLNFEIFNWILLEFTALHHWFLLSFMISFTISLYFSFTCFWYKLFYYLSF